MKAVHFGPGNIGRGLIGWLLSHSGYEICFVARNEKQIALLNQKKQYAVANENRDTDVVRNINAIHLKNNAAVVEKMTGADLITTAVGASALPSIAKIIAGGIEHRLRQTWRPVYIIACENALNGSTQLEQLVYSHLPKRLHDAAKRCVSFPNTLIDRIVPEQPDKGALNIKVEPYFEWVIDRSERIGDFPEIKGVQYVDSLQPYLERKLFTVNTGHCCAAYFGYLEGYRTIQEVMSEARLRYQVEQVLEETSKLLVQKHRFKEKEHRKYVSRTLERFTAADFTDHIERVGRSPLRKLAMNERLVQPALQASSMGIHVPNLVSAIAAALLYNNEQDMEAVILQAAIRQKGIAHVIRRHMGIPEEHPLHKQLKSSYEQMKKYKVC